MLEDSIPAAWASLNSWFTPALLFVVLNVMIGTIAIASGLGAPKQQQQQQQNQDSDNNQQEHPQLARSPSVLQRIKSINLYRYRSQDLTPFSSITTTTLPPPDEHEHTLRALNSFREQPQFESLHHLDTETEEPEPEPEPEAEFYHVEEEHHVTRTTSGTRPASGEMPVKLTKKMKKSASVKSAFSHFEEQDVLKARPATVREGKTPLQSFGDDEEVDAKADDFINKFKQQLKLQRMDSILRYKEMLGRGATTVEK